MQQQRFKNYFRAFFGVPLPEEIRESIITLTQDLSKKENFKKIKWVREENLHITLTFLGNISEELSQRLIKGVSKALKDISSFSTTFSSLTAFPSEKHPRVLVLSSLSAEPLIRLESIIKREATDCTINIETRPYIPHITIGRTKKKHFFYDLNKIEVEPMTIDVNQVTLFRSDLSSQGSIYTPIFQFPLKKT